MDPVIHMTISPRLGKVVREKKVSYNHTEIEGFGLTLEGKALSWFQALEPTSKYHNYSPTA